MTKEKIVELKIGENSLRFVHAEFTGEFNGRGYPINTITELGEMVITYYDNGVVRLKFDGANDDSYDICFRRSK